MGQKVHPYGFRLGVTKTWRSRWFAKQDYAKLLREDLELKDSLRDRLKAAGVSSIEVDRPGQQAADHDSHLAAGNHHRAQRRGDREAEGRPGQENQARSFHRYSGSSQAGAGRAAGIGIHRAAARKARGVPTGDAQERRFGAAVRLQGNQSSRVGALERRRNRAHRMVSARAASAAHAARRYRLRVQRSVHDVWRDRHQVLGL